MKVFLRAGAGICPGVFEECVLTFYGTCHHAFDQFVLSKNIEEDYWQGGKGKYRHDYWDVIRASPSPLPSWEWERYP
jgi:hypothetical protein